VRTGRGGVRLAGLLLPSLIVVVACGSFPTTGSPGAPVSTAVAPASGEGTAAGSAPVETADASPGTGAASLVVDADLLRVLPGTIDGVALEPDPATAAEIAADPSLAGSAEAIAVALAIRPGASSGDDLAIASVIRLRPGVFSDAWFGTWRTTYDQSACDVAGGVKGSPSQVAIGGRTVFVGTCAGDAQTYHVHLADPTMIVSVTAAGAAHFGELVMAGLAE
jgi:hypothetical protein